MKNFVVFSTCSFIELTEPLNYISNKVTITSYDVITMYKTEHDDIPSKPNLFDPSDFWTETDNINTSFTPATVLRSKVVVVSRSITTQNNDGLHFLLIILSMICPFENFSLTST